MYDTLLLVVLGFFLSTATNVICRYCDVHRNPEVFVPRSLLTNMLSFVCENDQIKHYFTFFIVFLSQFFFNFYIILHFFSPIVILHQV